MKKSAKKYTRCYIGGWEGGSMDFVYGPFLDGCCGNPRSLMGLQLDCMNLISKADEFPNAPIVVPNAPTQQANCFFANG
jgi:hypothetical protein